MYNYNGEPGAKTIAKLNRLIEQGPFEVGIAHEYSLEQAAEALQALDKHFLGKMILHPA
jgi:NADPH:quinone reductase